MRPHGGVVIITGKCRFLLYEVSAETRLMVHRRLDTWDHLSSSGIIWVWNRLDHMRTSKNSWIWGFLKSSRLKSSGII